MYYYLQLMGCDLRQGLDLQTCQATRESVQGNINRVVSAQVTVLGQTDFGTKIYVSVYIKKQEHHKKQLHKSQYKTLELKRTQKKSIYEEVGAPQEVLTQVIDQDVGAEEDQKKVQVSDQCCYMKTNLWQRSSDTDVNCLNCNHEWCIC